VSRIGILDRIAHEISYDAIQYNGVAHDRCAGWPDTQLDPFLPGELKIFGAHAVEKRCEWNR
jgi:hypothetical protein